MRNSRQKFLALAGLALVGAFTLWFFSGDSSPSFIIEVGGSSGLAELLSDQGIEGYAKAEEARQFTFPDDHGPHPEFRHEW